MLTRFFWPGDAHLWVCARRSLGMRTCIQACARVSRDVAYIFGCKNVHFRACAHVFRHTHLWVHTCILVPIYTRLLLCTSSSSVASVRVFRFAHKLLAAWALGLRVSAGVSSGMPTCLQACAHAFGRAHLSLGAHTCLRAHTLGYRCAHMSSGVCTCLWVRACTSSSM